jgi:type I restriction enzyme S subunit
MKTVAETTRVHHGATENAARALPEGWRWVRLADVCRVVSGSTPSSGTPEYWNGNIVWITPTDLGRLSGTENVLFSERCITRAGYDSCGTELVPLGSVVMSSRAPIGHLGIAMVPLCTNQGCKSFVPGRDLESEYLYHALAAAVPELQTLGSGATFSEVSKSCLEAFQIPLPPLPEQKRIAKLLSEQMAQVFQLRQALEDQLQAAAALPAAYLREVFTSDQALCWPTASVGSISSLITDGPHVTPKYQAKGVPFVTVRNIISGRIDFTNLSYISDADHAEFSQRAKAERGDILYTKDGTLGIPCVVDTDSPFSFFVSVALIKLLKNKADPYFVAFVLRSPIGRQQVELLASGAGLKHMVLKSIRALMIPLPTLSEQRAVVDRLQLLMAEHAGIHEGLKSQLAALDHLPAALMRQAFTGEV